MIYWLVCEEGELNKIAKEGQITEPEQQVVNILQQRMGLSPSKHQHLLSLQHHPVLQCLQGMMNAAQEDGCNSQWLFLLLFISFQP